MRFAQLFAQMREQRKSVLLALSAYSFPESFVFCDQPMLIDEQIRRECAPATGVAITPFRHSLVFLRQRFEYQLGKLYPCSDDGPAAVAVFEIEPANRESIRRRSPSQIDIDAAIQLRLRISIGSPTLAAGFDTQASLAIAFANRDTSFKCVPPGIAFNRISDFSWLVVVQKEDSAAEKPSLRALLQFKSLQTGALKHFPEESNRNLAPIFCRLHMAAPSNHNLVSTGSGSGWVSRALS